METPTLRRENEIYDVKLEKTQFKYRALTLLTLYKEAETELLNLKSSNTLAKSIKMLANRYKKALLSIEYQRLARN